jgi:hypothetical protein
MDIFTMKLRSKTDLSAEFPCGHEQDFMVETISRPTGICYLIKITALPLDRHRRQCIQYYMIENLLESWDILASKQLPNSTEMAVMAPFYNNL